MAGVNEGTTNIPSDAQGRHYAGRYREYDGYHYAPRAMGPVTILASAARTTSPTIPKRDNFEMSGVVIVVSSTSITSTPSVTVTILLYDPVSTATLSLLASAAITSVATTTLTIFPGATASANVAANAHLPPVWYLTSVHGDADSITYSITAHLLL